MKSRFSNLFFVLLAFLPGISFGQVGTLIIAVEDTICVTPGQDINLNVTDNDTKPNDYCIIWESSASSCEVVADTAGSLQFFSDISNCCGDTLHFSYTYKNCQSPGAPFTCTAKVMIIVKCPKPDCFLINIEDIPGLDPANPRCALVCENANSTFFATFNPSSTYTWTVSGGTFVPGDDAATIDICWGPAGPGAVSVAITNGGVTNTINACVAIMDGPVAAFTTSATSICKNSSVTFDGSTSTSGSSYFWDFGDGTTSSAQIETHTYTTPGIHTACLIVSKGNFDAEGNPLCCCSDTLCVDITVDSLEGPNIFCVSTLCSNDSTKYWTDAQNCGTYTWTVDGLTTGFTGQGTDTICVQWGTGPIGTVTLEVTGCVDPYCVEPVTVIIPIIPPTVLINGDKEVCENAIETYTVPKWISVNYDWDVMGGIIQSGDGSNTITVHWGAAGTGMITLNYYSDFLGGLPGQDPADCMGTATLKVDIKPRFEIGPNPVVVCLNTMSTFFSTPVPWPNYNWTVSGPGGTPTFTGDGTGSIIVTWDAGPGDFTVTATPTDPSVYCNDIATIYVKVVDVPDLLGIDGPIETCPGDTYTYFAQTDQTGVNFNWSVMNGTLSSSNGNPVTVNWGPSGPYQLSLQQIMAFSPGCSSAVFILDVKEKELKPPTITGMSNVCINSLWDYTAGPLNQHAEATYYWTISPSTLGSIALGQGTPSVDVQWNNNAVSGTLTLKVELCGDTLPVSIPITVNNPIQVAITQPSILCPNTLFTLNATVDPDIVTYLWSPIFPNVSTITTPNVGTYSVTTTDNNGCTDSDTFTAVALPAAPSAPPVLITICNNLPGAPATVTAQGPICACSYAWDCNGSPQATTLDFFIHTNTGGSGVFLYNVTVTDLISGCTAVSQITVVESLICPPPLPCTPDPTASISFTATNPPPTPPDCNIVNFTAFPINATLTGWDYGDQNGSTDFPNATHEYTKAGCYNVVLYADVLNVGPSGPPFCQISVTQLVNIPMVAAFSHSSICTTVDFKDETSSKAMSDDPTSWAWSFGDLAGGTSAMQDPSYTYDCPGTYTVSLTVTNAAGCVSSSTKTITVGGVCVSGIAITPTPACVGTPLTFCGINPLGNITQWDWNFGDTPPSTNGSPKPFHTYLLPGPYTVVLTVMDADGCTDMETVVLDVKPLPANDVIMVAPGLTVCDGTIVTLTAPGAPIGSTYTYLWSDALSSTTLSIMTTLAGTYSVTVTDENDCTMVPDPVTVVVIPLPEAVIAGNPFFCDDDCTVLSAPYGQNYTYLWSPTGEISRFINVCNAGTYMVTVTDNSTLLKCSAVSAPFDVMGAISPMFSIAIAPDDCEGMPVTLSIMSPEPDVTYAWSTGATGTSIIVTQAGTYHAVGRNAISGCTGSASATIHPLPNLCLVPVGCYEVCNPDTICGPLGLMAYQWNKDGVPIPGENGPWLIVTQSGTYSLTGTNDFGCMLTSDSLMLTVIDCTCFGLSASAAPAGTDSCCWKLSYNNPLNTLYKLKIHSNDADLGFSGLSGLFSSFAGFNSITLSNAVSSALPLPSGVLSNFITVCLSNVVNTPQQIIFDWYGVNGTILCSDTVDLYSQHFLEDTIFLCPGDTILLGGNPYTAPDIVMVTLPGAGGECDTLATYHLLLSPVHTITLNCPPNITVAVPGNTAMVNYPQPTATSTCPGSIPTVTQISGPSGNVFPLGETELCFMANDNENCCSKPDTCCFTVTVTNEDPCDVQMIACIKYELLSITKDLAGNQTYRIRVTNNCANNLLYVAFQVPDGIMAIAPANNAVYTAPSGRTYLVRNPNFSPYYSIRFKSIGAGISNGQSDIFEYILPPQVCQGCILATVRLSPKIYYEAHLCCVMPASLIVSPAVFEGPDLLEQPSEEGIESRSVEDALAGQFAVFPNPTDGTLFADLSDWENEPVHLQIFNSQGQLLQSRTVSASEKPQQIEMPKGLADGLYFLEVQTEKGARQMARFVLQH